MEESKERGETSTCHDNVTPFLLSIFLSDLLLISCVHSSGFLRASKRFVEKDLDVDVTK